MLISLKFNKIIRKRLGIGLRNKWVKYKNNKKIK